VFGSIGRSDSATDNAPLDMYDTTVMLKPRGEWRPGMTYEKLISEMDAKLQFPGLTGFREADVTKLVLSEKGKNPSVSIDKIVKLVQANDPLFPRERIRQIAHKMGVEGRRGRPRKNSAE
jgi:hypothetical protein